MLSRLLNVSIKAAVLDEMSSPAIKARTAHRDKVSRIKNHISSILENSGDYSEDELC